MNSGLQIVCVSVNAPPLNDAESLCTIRLLSELIRSGVGVHLVTSDPEATLDESLTRELMDERIVVTRVPMPRLSRLGRLGARSRHLLHAPGVEWIAPAVEATRVALARYPEPVLMTRAMPIVSSAVGYHCRREAVGWVAHFSDPYPPVEWQNHWYSPAARPLHLRWARRWYTAASLLTFTCPNALRYAEEKTGLSLRAKACVLTHLAVPPLAAGDCRLERCDGEFVLAHFGNLMQRRRPEVIFAGVMRAAERIPRLRFVQYGHVDDSAMGVLEGGGSRRVVDVHRVANLSPRDSSDLRRQVDANMIVDADLGMPYSPFIPSKYPHSAGSGKPLLMVTQDDSAMADYTRRFGGGICVPYEAGALADAICILAESVKGSTRAHEPTRELVEEFGPGRIVDPFVERLGKVLGRPGHG